MRPGCNSNTATRVELPVELAIGPKDIERFELHCKPAQGCAGQAENCCATSVDQSKTGAENSRRCDIIIKPTSADIAGKDSNWRQRGKLADGRESNCRAGQSELPILRSGEHSKQLFVDSRSILSHKEELKLFWEHKMELDLKLKSSELLISSNNGNKQREQTIQQANKHQEDENNNQQLNNQNIKPNDNHNDDKESEQLDERLISLDPSLCHQQLVSCKSSDREHKPNADLQLEQEHRKRQVSFDEEQTANEEFLSSNSSAASSTSFGPMSMSVEPQVAGLGTSELAVTEDDQSVSTVIECEPKDGLTCDSDLVAQAADAVGTDLGVAFESLHFDTRIKSSREEAVEDVDFASPVASQNKPKLKARPRNLANFKPKVELSPDNQPEVSDQKDEKCNLETANDITSVCQLITAAISDASQQVEKLISREANENNSNQQNLTHSEPRFCTANEPAGFGLQRATFISQEVAVVCERQQVASKVTPPSGQLLNRWHDDQDHQGDDVEAEDSLAQSRADLSSMFEANVRREIQRFEVNLSSSQSGSKFASSGGQVANKALGSTEWRIAEEIRQFNERESELRSRSQRQLKSADSVEAKGRTGNKQVEVVIRFGKRFEIPRSQVILRAQESSNFNSKEAPNSANSGLKLTSKSDESAASTTISLHKSSNGFGSSGKRAAPTSTSKQQESSEAKLQQQQVDYKASDSFNCKEKPNVKPGIARKVIESFSLLSTATFNAPRHEQSASLQGLNINLEPAVKQLASSPSIQQQQQQHQQQVPSNSSNSAEFKIQQELREMRAREAELRQLRSAASRKKVAPTPAVPQKVEPHCDKHEVACEEQLSCLYPIKETIDSFRRLNSSQTIGTTTQDSQIICEHSNANGKRTPPRILDRWLNGRAH